jgi:type III secretory pathway component EscS
MFWLVTLPFRIVFGLIFGLLALPFALLAIPFALLFLPFLLLRFAMKAIFAVLFLPLALVIGVAAVIGLFVALVGVAVALLVPLLPFAFAAFCVWAILRVASPPAVV